MLESANFPLESSLCALVLLLSVSPMLLSTPAIIPQNVITGVQLADRLDFGRVTDRSESYLPELSSSNTSQPPVALFSFTLTNPRAGAQLVYFDASASYAPGGSISNYTWNFGDFQTGFGMSVSHFFAQGHAFNVTLTVMDSNGATGVVSHDVLIPAVYGSETCRLTICFDVTSNSTISDAVIGSSDFRFNLTGPAGIVAFANVTFPVSVVPVGAQFQVTDDGVPLLSSQVTNGTDGTLYWVAFILSLQGPSAITINFTAALTTGSLTVTVSGPGGPIQGANVTLIFMSPGQSLWQSGTTDPYGSVTFSSLLPGNYTLYVSAFGYTPATRTVMVAAGGTMSTTVALTPSQPTMGLLKVTVSGPNGPVQGATVTITAGPYRQTLPSAGTTDANGVITFTGLLPGDYTYQVTATGYQNAQNTVTVTAGTTKPSSATLSKVQQTPSAPASDYTVYYAVGGVAALVVVIGVFVALRRRPASSKAR